MAPSHVRRLLPCASSVLAAERSGYHVVWWCMWGIAAVDYAPLQCAGHLLHFLSHKSHTVRDEAHIGKACSIRLISGETSAACTAPSVITTAATSADAVGSQALDMTCQVHSYEGRGHRCLSWCAHSARHLHVHFIPQCLP